MNFTSNKRGLRITRVRIIRGKMAQKSGTKPKEMNFTSNKRGLRITRVRIIRGKLTRKGGAKLYFE